MDTVSFDLFDPTVMADPYPYYRILLDRAPVHFNEETGMYSVSRYADIVALNRNWEILRRGTAVTDAFAGLEHTTMYRLIAQRSIISLDGRDHSRVRRLATKSFTPRSLERLVPLIDELCVQLLDEAGLNPNGGSIELVSAFAYPLPFLVICELLGIEREDRTAFLRWARNVIALSEPGLTAEGVQLGVEAAGGFEGYLTAVLEDRKRRLRGGKTLPPGMISDLVIVNAEDQDRLDSEDLMSLCIVMLLAGFENVINLIGNTLRALVENPEQERALRADTALYRNLPDEALRYYTTAQYNRREATEEFTLHGVTIPKKAPVLLLRGAANRDERHFADPDRFDLRRANCTTHVGFGEGPARCFGAPLARLEVRAAFKELFRRFPTLHIARWSPSTAMITWGASAIDVEYTLAAN